MAEIRMDSAVYRWVIVSTDNPMAPADFEPEPRKKGAGSCPFCPGNERMTPPEITTYRPRGGQANDPSWSLRVFPNRFPALRIEGQLDRTGAGVYDLMNGVGAHEVIVETPDHSKELADLEPHQMELLMRAFQERSIDLRKDKRFKYLLIFKNHGASAGASLSHSHCQLIALPIVPKRVMEEIRGADRYYEQNQRCVFCEMIRQETSERSRVVLETPMILCFAPFASRFPFELWLIPKNHAADFAASSPELLKETGEALRHLLIRIREVLRNPSYNFLIHTSPLAATPPEGYHWHIELMPRLTRVAGFEWGSGFYVNPTPPEVAAKYLRGEK